MKGITFSRLKEKFKESEQRDAILRKKINKLLVGVPVREVVFSKGKIIITAQSKAGAQELFFRKNKLEQDLKASVVVR